MFIDQEAASQPIVRARIMLLVDMGLKGGIAKDARRRADSLQRRRWLKPDGRCRLRPEIPQGQILIEGVVQGCGPYYGKNHSTWTPLCPSQNNIFIRPTLGHRGTTAWPPMRCIKTRPTGSMNQIERGFDDRFFGNPNAPCPPQRDRPVRGRNYWDKDTVKGTSPADDSAPPEPDNPDWNRDDPRIVTSSSRRPSAFTGTGQNTYPITGFIEVYITGYGRISGNGSL